MMGLHVEPSTVGPYKNCSCALSFSFSTADFIEGCVRVSTAVEFLDAV
jgi:hypothetical protein